MIETILLALLYSKLRGYKLKPLFKSWTIYPVVLFELIYVIFQIMIFNENYMFIKYSGIMHMFYILSFLPMIIMCKLNYSAIIGSISIFVGTILNKFAIANNGGKMPVFPTLSYYTGYIKVDSFIRLNDIHILGDENTKLKLLTDIFDVGYSIMSIGDIFIRMFAFIIIINFLRYSNKYISTIVL
ncbi:MAG: DUF5317 family protein [Clostridiaceae bacterium]